jgi:CheY-like chemotaxis protein
MPADAATILYVDDEKPILEMMRMSLEKMGHTVATADDPFAALGLFESDPRGFDLVITDQSMPVMNGDRLAEKLLDIRPDIPIIMCSGTSDVDVQQALALGIRAYLQKPVGRARMAQTIREALSQPQLPRPRREQPSQPLMADRNKTPMAT